MAKVIYYSFENQTEVWIKKRTLEVSEVEMLTKLANSDSFKNDKLYFFNKFECFKDDGIKAGEILTLNPHLFT